MSREMKKRAVRAALIWCGAGALGLFLFFLRMPCLILRTTGFYCAGCGFQRMLSCLLRWDLLGAFRQNPFLLLMLPFLCGALLWGTARYIKGKPPLWKFKAFSPLLCCLLAVAIAFTVLRNLPGFSYLGPN